MDFSLPEERQMIADTLERYLAQRYPIDVRHAINRSPAGWSREQWAGLAEIGMIGVLFGEADGGFGGTGFDVGVLFERLGRALVVEPFLGTLIGGRALTLAGGQDALVAEIIAGTSIVTFAGEEVGSRFDPAAIDATASPSQGKWSLTGVKTVVPQLAAADRIVVTARTGGTSGEASGIGLFLVESTAPGVGIRDYPLIDGGHGGELRLDGAPAALLAQDAFPLVEQAVAAGIVALSWEAVGVMDVLKASTVEYLRTRKQFGVPIGKFQALQHRMATVAIEIEQARSAAINAAAALESNRNGRERAVSAAKFTIGRVGTLVAEEAIQLHGGIGMTDELPLSHYAKRLTMIGHQLGDEDYHLERFIALGRAA